MSKLLPNLFLGALILASSCVKEGKTYQERKTVGEWKFVDAFYRLDNSFAKEDVLDDYKDRTLILTEGTQARYEMEDLEEVYSGYWEIEYIEDPDSDPECPTGTNWFRLYLSRESDLEPLLIVWSGYSVNNRKMKGFCRSGLGGYHFTLMKCKQHRKSYNSNSSSGIE
jgi:hypothetical protein